MVCYATLPKGGRLEQVRFRGKSEGRAVGVGWSHTTRVEEAHKHFFFCPVTYSNRDLISTLDGGVT